MAIDFKKVEGYTYNFFAFPDGYFENHTAEELNLNEEERNYLIELQRDKNPSSDSEMSFSKEKEEFIRKIKSRRI